MAESTLALSYLDFMRTVARDLGWGFRATLAEGLTAEQVLLCDRYVQEGLRLVYFPDYPGGHEWSFFKPLRTLTAWPTSTPRAALTLTGDYDDETDRTTLTASADAFFPSMVGRTIEITDVGAYEIVAYLTPPQVVVAGEVVAVAATFGITATGAYLLPDEFRGLDGGLTIEPPDGRPPIKLTSERQLRDLRSGALGQQETGRPQQAAVRPLECTGVTGQRFELLLYPVPDKPYALLYATNVLPGKISAEQPYPLGGAALSRLFDKACLAAAESGERENESRVRREEFAAALAAAIDADRKIGLPDTLGRMGARRWRHDRHGSGYVTYQGILPGG